MNRRSILVGVGLFVSSAIAGCLNQFGGGEASNEEIRRRACSHVPDEAGQVSHDVTRVEFHFLREEYAPLTFVTAPDQIESRVDSGQREHVDIEALFEDVDFNEQVVLIWEETENITTDNVEFLGVTQPNDETLRAYGCDYRLGPGGQASTPYSFIITVDVDETPQQAELLVQNEDEDTRTLTAE